MPLDGNHAPGDAGHVTDHNELDTTIDAVQTRLDGITNNPPAGMQFVWAPTGDVTGLGDGVLVILHTAPVPDTL